MTHQNNDSRLDAVMELLIENSFDGFADMLRILLNEAMRIERENALAARTYQMTPDRKGYANGYKPKTGRPPKPQNHFCLFASINNCAIFICSISTQESSQAPLLQNTITIRSAALAD